MAEQNIEAALQQAIDYQRAGRLSDAEGLYRQILTAEPNHAWALNNLGSIWKSRGDLEEARDHYQRAAALDPGLMEARANLASLCESSGQYQDAVHWYRQGLVIEPRSAELWSKLGGVLQVLKEWNQALEAYQQALRVDPGLAEVYSNLGTILGLQGKLEPAITCHRRAVELKPLLNGARYNLANALRDAGRLDEAEAAYREVLLAEPGHPDAHNNLASTLKDKGDLDAAIVEYQEAVRCRPESAAFHSNLIYTMQFHGKYDRAALAAEERLFDKRHALPLAGEIQPHKNAQEPERRLRVGYVSPDFRMQAGAFFVTPLLEAHDHEQFEIHCYASIARPDAITERIKHAADVWHDVLGMSDAQVADQVRRDGIDILVDLTMHMANNRLRVFARKPAPVQACWIAYPGSTGLSAVDYRISDPYLDPEGVIDTFYSEKTIRLPESYWCYHPLLNGMAVGPLPAKKNGFITFGALNNFCKVHDHLLGVWGRVMKSVPDSRLMLLAPEGNVRRRVHGRLKQEGVEAGRVRFVGMMPREKYFAHYNEIDICLDTFSCNGHTTSLDALWMGVPVVTLVGPTSMGRAGLCQLTNLGLTNLIARTPEEYVQIAENTATDVPRLEALRAELRGQMERSPLMDTPRFAKNMENVYRQMWRVWCKH